jgi:hypothetical protein
LSGRREHVVPACRHAVGTISSSDVSDVRRTVSEETDQLSSGFLAIHRLSNFGDRRQPFPGQVTTSLDLLDALCKLLEVLLLRGSHRILPEERNHDFQQFYPPPHNEAMQVLFVVVVPLIREYLSHSEELAESMETRNTTRTLCDREFMSNLITGLVAFPARPIWLPDETEREASFPVYKTNNPAEFNQSFLLIACTGRIVTHDVSRREYHQILRVSSTWPDAHRTVTGAEGSESTLGPFVMLRPISGRRDLVTRSACRHAGRTVSSLQCSGSGVQSLRVPDRLISLVFPADCLHLCIVTSISQHQHFTGSIGYSGFPAYSRIY